MMVSGAACHPGGPLVLPGMGLLVQPGMGLSQLHHDSNHTGIYNSSDCTHGEGGNRLQCTRYKGTNAGVLSSIIYREVKCI